MISSKGCFGGAPGLFTPCCGAGVIYHIFMPEREDTWHVILRSSFCNTGWYRDWLQWAGGDGRVYAVSIGLLCAIAVHLGGTPGGGGVVVRTLIVLHSFVDEGKYTLGALKGHAGVGHLTRWRRCCRVCDPEGGGTGCSKEAGKMGKEHCFV